MLRQYTSYEVLNIGYIRNSVTLGQVVLLLLKHKFKTFLNISGRYSVRREVHGHVEQRHEIRTRMRRHSRRGLLRRNLFTRKNDRQRTGKGPFLNDVMQNGPMVNTYLGMLTYLSYFKINM